MPTFFTDEAVQEVVDRIRRVPSTWRQYTVTADDLYRIHRVDPALQARLLDAGLPCKGAGDDRLFDQLDLENLGLGLRLGPRWRIMRWWSEALSEHERFTAETYRIRIPLDCPAPSHSGECAFELDPALVQELGPNDIRPDGVEGFCLDVARGPLTPFHLGAEFDGLITDAAALHFHMLPNELTRDNGFVAETGLADCRSASRHLIRRGGWSKDRVKALGGLFIGVPLPTWHIWLHVQVDGQWHSADPFLLATFARWGIVDPTRWPPGRSIDGLTLAVDPAHFQAVGHAGAPWQKRLRAVNETLLHAARS
jgi:hypothetical protein